MEIGNNLILELALKRIKQAFEESSVNSIYIDENDIVLELHSGRSFMLSCIEIEYQAKEMLKEILE
jgi:hypothetical protein